MSDLICCDFFYRYIISALLCTTEAKINQTLISVAMLLPAAQAFGDYLTEVMVSQLI